MTQSTPTPEIPRSAELIRAFVNTRDIEAGTDAFASTRGLVDWLQAVGILDEPVAGRDRDRRLAVSLREALRSALVAHHDDGDEPAAPELQGVAADLRLRVAFPPGGPRLQAAEGGVRGALATVVAAVQDAVADGSWPRLKVCPADNCSWAFYDASRNRSRTWCSMGVCGNRSKTRTFRARHAAD